MIKKSVNLMLDVVLNPIIYLTYYIFSKVIDSRLNKAKGKFTLIKRKQC